ncbi:MAG: PEP-CTERM sorting domain-containing protein [Bryobacteraceae bacterium]
MRKPQLSRACVALFFLIFLANLASAALITFEGFAPANSLINISPSSPYREAGFTLTPSNANSAVFGPSAASTFSGDPTSWFGFAGGNLITLTGPAQFDVASFLAGRSTISTVPTISLTVVGHQFGGGTLSTTFSGLGAATLETLNWTNLSSMTFLSTSDAGLDNLSVAPSVPEPATLPLLGMGLVSILVRRAFTHP